MDATQALLHPHACVVEMSFPGDSRHLCVSLLDLPSLWGLFERQLICMTCEECSPESHLSVPPPGLEHCLETCSADPTQGPPAHTRAHCSRAPRVYWWEQGLVLPQSLLWILCHEKTSLAEVIPAADFCGVCPSRTNCPCNIYVTGKDSTCFS